MSGDDTRREATSPDPSMDQLARPLESSPDELKVVEATPKIPAEINGINTDSRPPLSWKSRYNREALWQISIDATYIAIILVVSMVSLFLTWRGTAFEILADGCSTCSRETFDKYAYFYLGGFFGGVLFGVKYLYKVVARCYWNIDRRLWRIFSPFLSGGLALVIGALIDSGVLGLTIRIESAAAYFSYGFIAGYFADRAIDKMQEVAETVFGAPGRKDPPKA
jgi:hypothetical protein